MNLIPWKNARREGGNGNRRETLPALRQEIDTLFDRFFQDPFGTDFGLAGWGGGLRSDLVETEDEVIVKAELPGVDAKDVEINVTGNTLTITGEKKEEHQEKKHNYHYVERQFGSFQRSFELPGYVDADKVDATFRNGVLTVTIAKRPEAKPRKIAVNTGS